MGETFFCLRKKKSCFTREIDNRENFPSLAIFSTNLASYNEILVQPQPTSFYLSTIGNVTTRWPSVHRPKENTFVVETA